MTPELITFGRYLAGEFENQRQAQAEPVWYVHLRLWLRPLPLFREDSIALFAEQASIITAILILRFHDIKTLAPRGVKIL